ncbi:gb [Venturia nashicola]|nr:gb [Venturia nashicola]
MPYLLSHKQKTIAHITQLLLIHVAIGCTVPRIFMKNQPRTRANTIAMGMGAKSIMFIFYQLITENIQKFKRWGSLKAYMIINILEVVFWGAVVFLVIQANLSRCKGTSCYLSWAVVGVSIVIVMIQTPLAYFYTMEFRENKKQRSLAASSGTGYESGQSMTGTHGGRRDEEMAMKEATAHGQGVRGY